MKVLVADGHPAMRLGIKVLLEVMEDMWVVGETGVGAEALELVEETNPQLVILGLNLLGGIDGVEVCWRLKALPSPPHVLVHASCGPNDGVSSCLLAGADGYLRKDACREEFLASVRRTAAGGRVWRPETDDAARTLLPRAYVLPRQSDDVRRAEARGASRAGGDAGSSSGEAL